MKIVMLTALAMMTALLATPVAVADPTHDPENVEDGQCFPMISHYDPDAFLNVCLLNDPDGDSYIDPEFMTLGIICIIGNICVPFPILGPGGMNFGGPVPEQGLYIEVVCNQPWGCGCEDTGAIEICTWFFER